MKVWVLIAALSAGSLAGAAPAPGSLTATAAAAPTAVPTAAVTEAAPVPATAVPTPEHTPSATPTPAVVAPAAWAESGLEYRFSVGLLSVFNGSPLSYTPVELGWRFANGLRLSTGMEIFYYEGIDHDDKQPGLGDQNYSYSMQNWRSSVLYVVPLPFRVRPLAGLSLELMRGTRQLSTPGLLNAPTIDAWNAIGSGGILGVEFRGGPSWAASLTGRYTFSFGTVAPWDGLDLGWHYLF